MEPYNSSWYSAPQQQVPLLVQLQDAFQMQQSMDPFAAYEADDFLPLPQQQIPDVVVPEAAPEPELNWRQRLANRAAGPLAGISSQDERDLAMRRGMGEFGNVLLQAALAPDARSRAAVLSRALPAAQGAFRKELGGAVEIRRGEEERAYEQEKRAREAERYEYDKGQRERASEMQGRQDAEGEALLGQVGEWKTQLSTYLRDSDIGDNQRGELSLAGDAAITAFSKNPTPENASKVFGVIRAAASAADREEELMREVGDEHLKEAAKLGVSPDEYAKILARKVKKDELDFHITSLQLARAQAGLADDNAQRELNTRLRELQGTALEGVMGGTPMTLPDGTIVAPDAPGLSFLRPPRTAASGGQAAKDLASVMKNRDFSAWLSGEQGVDAGLVKQLSLLGINSPEEFDAKAAEIYAGSVAPSSGGTPQEIKVSRAKIQAAATKDGVSFDEMLKRFSEQVGGKVTVID